MIPGKTIEKVGTTTLAAIIDRAKRNGIETHEDYAIEGFELVELAVLATRMNARLDDAEELRDWQNRLNVLVDKIRSRPVA